MNNLDKELVQFCDNLTKSPKHAVIAFFAKEEGEDLTHCSHMQGSFDISKRLSNDVTMCYGLFSCIWRYAVKGEYEKLADIAKIIKGKEEA